MESKPAWPGDIAGSLEVHACRAWFWGQAFRSHLPWALTADGLATGPESRCKGQGDLPPVSAKRR